MTRPLDDAAIARLVDGELSPEEAMRLATAAAADPALAERVARARALRQAVSEAYADAAADPPPARLEAAIAASAPAIDLAAARAARAGRRGLRPAPTRWTALAAGLAAAFLAGRLLAPAPSGSPVTMGPAGLQATGVLAGALQAQLVSTQNQDAPVRIGVSYEDRAGRYCRTFILRRAAPIAGLACRETPGWRVEMMLAAPPAPATQYRTAASETPAPILDAVDQSIRGAPLDAPSEEKARASGWRPPALPK